MERCSRGRKGGTEHSFTNGYVIYVLDGDKPSDSDHLDQSDDTFGNIGLMYDVCTTLYHTN